MGTNRFENGYSMSVVSEDSYGVANAIMTNAFLEKFIAGDNSIAVFYGQQSCLNCNGTEHHGREAISAFIESQAVQGTTLEVKGWEVQTVPGSDLWSMIVAFGSLMSCDGSTTNFHSTLYVESKSADKTAFVRYHTFNTF